jgi:hypothetical protein
MASPPQSLSALQALPTIPLASGFAPGVHCLLALALAA